MALGDSWPALRMYLLLATSWGRVQPRRQQRVVLPRAGTVEDLFAAEENREHDADDDQLAVANAAIEVVTRRFGAPLYARVDLVPDNEEEICTKAPG
jgi:hypothetical protein